MSMAVDDHVLELLPDYVLDILADADASLVAEHLVRCQACHAEYARLQQVADDLPLALAQAAPPPRLKDNLMRAINPGLAQPAGARGSSFWQRLKASLRTNLPAYSLALIVVLALGNFLLWRQVSTTGVHPGTGMLVFALVNTADAPEASGTLIMDQNGHYGTLVVDGLPIPEPGIQYQVWLSDNGDRISAGLFDVNYEGYGSMELTAPDPLIQYDSIGITLEPHGGSPAPTGAKVMGGDLTP